MPFQRRTPTESRHATSTLELPSGQPRRSPAVPPRPKDSYHNRINTPIKFYRITPRSLLEKSLQLPAISHHHRENSGDPTTGQRVFQPPDHRVQTILPSTSDLGGCQSLLSMQLPSPEWPCRRNCTCSRPCMRVVSGPTGCQCPCYMPRLDRVPLTQPNSTRSVQKILAARNDPMARAI